MIFITEQVLDEITEATRRGRQQSLEFGGSLLAHEQDGEILVAYALPTGPSAKQGPGHLQTDVNFQNIAIERVRRRCPGLHYVGDWHVHPMWMPYLSHTDVSLPMTPARSSPIWDARWNHSIH
jgi:proteasome lid subunit RPN8/RPN11